MHAFDITVLHMCIWINLFSLFEDQCQINTMWKIKIRSLTLPWKLIEDRLECCICLVIFRRVRKPVGDVLYPRIPSPSLEVCALIKCFLNLSDWRLFLGYMREVANAHYQTRHWKKKKKPGGLPSRKGTFPRNKSAPITWLA